MNNREGSRPPENLDAEAAEPAAAQNTATRAVRSGEHQVPPHSPAVTPVYQTAPFMFDSAEALVAGFERPDQRGLYSRLANPVERHPSIELESIALDEIARRQMSAGGAMVAFEVRGGLPAANRLLDSLRLFTIMASLGGVESSVVLAAVTSHKNLTPAEREAQGIGDGLIRLSIGIEEGSDLEADLAQALSRVAG